LLRFAKWVVCTIITNAGPLDSTGSHITAEQNSRRS
jgi:hypothetical protein